MPKDLYAPLKTIRTGKRYLVTARDSSSYLQVLRRHYGENSINVTEVNGALLDPYGDGGIFGVSMTKAQALRLYNQAATSVTLTDVYNIRLDTLEIQELDLSFKKVTPERPKNPEPADIGFRWIKAYPDLYPSIRLSVNTANHAQAVAFIKKLVPKTWGMKSLLVTSYPKVGVSNAVLEFAPAVRVRNLVKIMKG